MNIKITKNRKRYFVSIGNPHNTLMLFHPRGFKTSLDALKFANTVVKKYI